MGRVPHDDHIEEEVADMEAESPSPDNRLSAVESARMVGGDLENLSCPVANADGQRCKLTRGHTGFHLAYGGASWGDDDGQRCGVVDGRRGKACILDQDHDGAHSDSGRTWPNKPAKADYAGGATCPAGHWVERVGARCNQCPASARARGVTPVAADVDPELAATVPASGKVGGGRRKRAPAAAPPDAVTPLEPEVPARYEPALEVAKIRPSKDNPRRRKPEMEDLVASVRVHGVIVPIEVRYRPDPETGTDYEINCGECRWTACTLVGRTTIPARIIECSDEVAFERRVIENLQRNDVHPIDEAEGFRAMLTAGRDVDYIAHKTGKSISWIYSRLKLCDLAPEVRDQVSDDGLAPSVALLIARIPSAKHQLWAAREVMRADPDDVQEQDGKAGVDTTAADYQAHIRRLDALHERMWSNRAGHFDEANARGVDNADDRRPPPMSVREARAHIQRHYMTRLELATFDMGDEHLVQGVGSCTKCTYRTGNQGDLFNDVGRGDVCTNPPCFDQKTRAAFERAAAPAVEAGAKVLEEAVAKQIFDPLHQAEVRGSSPYVEPDAPVPYDLLPTSMHNKRPTWEKLLGKKGLAEVDKVVAQDGAGAARQLIEKSDAVKKLRAAGKLPDKKERAQKDSAKVARERQDRVIQDRAVELALQAFHEKAAAPFPVKKEGAIWIWLAKILTQADTYAAENMMIERRGKGAQVGDEVPLGIDTLLNEARGGADARALLVEFAAAAVATDLRFAGAAGKAFEQGCLLFGIDWAKCQKAARAEAEVQAGAAKPKATKKGAKKR
jgi:ParB/RepB/Spo0J family partition protein